MWVTVWISIVSTAIGVGIWVGILYASLYGALPDWLPSLKWGSQEPPFCLAVAYYLAGMTLTLIRVWLKRV